MFGSFERMVAFRYLRARRKEGFISVIAGFSLLGIMLGVATLIIVMSVMNGFRSELVARVLGLNGHLSIYSTTGEGLTDFDALADRVRTIPGVRQVMPTIEGQVLVSAGQQAAGGALRGVVPDDFLNRPSIKANLVLSAPDAFQGTDVVAIGSRMAARFGLGLGDDITLVTPKASLTAFGSVPRSKTYRIVGIFDVGMFEYDSSFVYMPLEAAQLLLQMKDRVSGLDVFVDDPDDLGFEETAIRADLPPRTGVWNWQQANNTFFTALKVERNVMFVILTLIILVAAFNIISGLVMLVKDKSGDIAILRTMGATRGAVLRIFFLTGAAIGTVGTLLGLGLGVAFAANIETIRQWLQSLTGTTLFDAEIYFLSQLPAEMDTSEVVLVCVMSLALSFLASIYPAWRAARLDPVEALRYE